jgi:flagellar protein FlgJ
MTVQSIATSNFSELKDLKLQAKQDAKEALPAVAKQFEAIFLQSMLKSMRMAEHFLDDASPFKGKNSSTFQEMLDGQYVGDITNSKGIGLATMLTKQLEGTVGKAEKKSTEIGLLNPDKDPILPLKKQNFAVTPALAASVKEENKDSPLNTIDDFVKSLWPKAKEAASLMGLDPKILMAQAALETGWGKFMAKDTDGTSSNNLFNVKTGNNTDFDSVKIKTTEYIADTPIKVSASFRKYSSVEESFNDYVSLIKGNERYQNALANASNPELYVNELSKAGYATDPNYGNKILSIYHGDELKQAMQRCGLSEAI